MAPPQIFQPRSVGGLPQFRIPRVRTNVDPGMSPPPPLGPQFEIDPGMNPPSLGPRRQPQVNDSGALNAQQATGEGEGSIMQQIRDRSVRDLDALGNASIHAGAQPGAGDHKAGFGTRFLTGLESAPNVFDPESPDFAQAALGSGLAAFQGIARTRQASEEEAYKRNVTQQGLGIRGRLAAAAEEQARAATERAQAERDRAAHPATGGLTLQEREELQRIAHQNRMEEIGATGTEARKTRTTPLPPRAGGANAGISAVDRAILARYDKGNAAGRAAVAAAQSQRASAERTMGPEIHPEITDPDQRRAKSLPPLRAPLDEASTFSRAAHEANPTFSADSAAAQSILNRMRPPLSKPATPVYPPSGRDPYDVLRGFLRNQGGGGPTSSVRPGAQPGPSSAGTATDEGLSRGEETGNLPGTLTHDEIESALGLIDGLDEQEARDELENAGYEKDEIDEIMSRR